MDEAINFIREYKPKIIIGYVGAINEFSNYIREENLYLPPPQAIWVTSSPISKLQRENIQDAFNAPIYDQYGYGEVFSLAAECYKHKGLHVFTDARYIEILDQKGNPCRPGELGRIIITDLKNYCFPIIRYETGDMGKWIKGKCTCGVNFPLIDHIKGRKTDMIKLPSGGMISGDFLTTIFDDYPFAIKSFRIHQYKDHSIHLNVVPEEKTESNIRIIRKVFNNLKSLINEEVSMELNILKRLDHENGKYRFVVSDL